MDQILKNKGWILGGLGGLAALYLHNAHVKKQLKLAQEQLREQNAAFLEAAAKQAAEHRQELLSLTKSTIAKVSNSNSKASRKASFAEPVPATQPFFESTIQENQIESKSAVAVANWVTDLNPEFKQYRERFIKAGVNSNVLFALNDTMLRDDLGISSALHRSTILKFRSQANFDGQQREMTLPKRDTANNEPLNISAMANKKGLEDVDWSGKRVLMRVDYNVPFDDQGEISDTARIDATIDSITYILGKSAELKAAGKPGIKSLCLICHLGRPPTGLSFNPARFSLEPCKAVLEDRLGINVEFLPDCVGEAVEKRVFGTEDGTVFLLQNLRFHMEETGKAVNREGKTHMKATKEQVAAFAGQLSKLGDVFVFEAFGAAHRSHASVVGITCPERVAGKLMKKELEVYSSVLGSPARPFLGIIGGAKVSDKIHVLMNLLDVVDELIIGGGMAYTFKKVLHDVKIGASIFQEDAVELVKQVFRKASANNVRIHLPVDHIIGDRFHKDCKVGFAMDNPGIPDGWIGMDVGPQTRTINAKAITRAKTILWNGPLGVFEWGHFSAGTASCMFHMVEATKKGTVCIIGGGDTGAAASKYFYGPRPVANQLTHVSTGGGSSLVLMEGKTLPAVPCLSDRNAAAAQQGQAL